ncbi:MAG TPA: phosphatase PAP2 family protein [Candidatus Saccharimonadales bacterium]|jgi:membrane-associated phospholipid phosphatase|nr:phosphatase PAP2 family protein [Candidatus Saccharimonadales bacterium]
MYEELYALFVHVLADWLIIPIILVGVFALIRYVPRARRYQVYVRIGMMGLSALLIGKLMTLVYQPDTIRPFLEAGVQPGALYLNNPGFPSDHTLLVFTITLAVWVATKKTKLTTFLLLCSMAVGVGRVVALVHTPADVLGAIVAVAIAGLIWYHRELFTIKK